MAKNAGAECECIDTTATLTFYAPATRGIFVIDMRVTYSQNWPIPQAGRSVLGLPTQGGCKAELTWFECYTPFTR